MQLLKLGSSGEDVKHWQYFLIGQGFYADAVTGKFDEATRIASIGFQTKYNLDPDGIVGNKTVGQAMLLGFGVLEDTLKNKLSANWPAKPSFNPMINTAQRQKIFGTFQYVPKPIPNNPENIEITGNWARENIIAVDVPQLKPIKGSSTVYFHKSAAEQLKKLWSDWQKANLLHLVFTWGGSYVPRFIRGSTTVLSNHAFGSAFDINYEWNKLGAVPALVGDTGSVRELVPIANENGFYWGGHFTRLDGMHFEVAKLL